MILKIIRRNTRSHCKGNWLWKRLWTCRKAVYVMLMMISAFYGHSIILWWLINIYVWYISNTRYLAV